ncbi:MAG: hypothetical protein ACK5IJ_05175 [Mangrovibacterium sp.]
MNRENNLEFIKNAGGCIVSKNILDGKGNLKWILREKSVDAVDICPHCKYILQDFTTISD